MTTRTRATYFHGVFALLLLGTLGGCSTARIPFIGGGNPAPAPVAARVPPAPAPTPAVQAPAAQSVDYRRMDHWLCRPGRADACSAELTAAGPGGAVQTLAPHPNPAIDCFYVYPTVSADPGGNSDLVPGVEERRAAQHQLAPFGSECRLYAPMYRQVTLAGLTSRFTGGNLPIDDRLPYADIREAWRDYLANDNKGRGVVLIGHSQGALRLAELLARDIEGTPAQSRVVSALLVGLNVAVPKGGNTPAWLKGMTLCRTGEQTGCIVAYTSFRANAAPPATSLFGRVNARTFGATDAATHSVACVNPAALTGSDGALHALLPTRENLLGQPTTAGTWGTRIQGLQTTFVALPGVMKGQCVERDGASYLAVEFQPVPGWSQPDVAGDVVSGGRVLPEWGLHLVDMNLAMGNLVQLVRRQAAAYRGALN